MTHTLDLFFHLGLEGALLQLESLGAAKHLTKNSSSDPRTGQDSSGEEDSDDEEPNNSTIEVALCTLYIDEFKFLIIFTMMKLANFSPHIDVTCTW